jgi:hypothetical protein
MSMSDFFIFDCLKHEQEGILSFFFDLIELSHVLIQMFLFIVFGLFAFFRNFVIANPSLTTPTRAFRDVPGMEKYVRRGLVRLVCNCVLLRAVSPVVTFDVIRLGSFILFLCLVSRGRRYSLPRDCRVRRIWEEAIDCSSREL